MACITAAQFGKRHGALCRAEYSGYTGYEALRTVLLQRHPQIDVPAGVLRQWLKRSVKPADAITVSSAEDLQEKYGDLVKGLVLVHATAYRLCQAFRLQSPAVYCSDGIAKQWIKKYGTELQYINSAGHLELMFGARIREDDKAQLDAPQLKVLLQTALSVDASVSTCQTWRCREWSTSGKSSVSTPSSKRSAIGCDCLSIKMALLKSTLRILLKYYWSPSPPWWSHHYCCGSGMLSTTTTPDRYMSPARWLWSSILATTYAGSILISALMHYTAS